MHRIRNALFVAWMNNWYFKAFWTWPIYFIPGNCSCICSNTKGKRKKCLWDLVPADFPFVHNHFHQQFLYIDLFLWNHIHSYMAVYYKFKSAKDYELLPLEGHFISIQELKTKIFESKYLSKPGTDIDIVISNAETGQGNE